MKTNKTIILTTVVNANSATATKTATKETATTVKTETVVEKAKETELLLSECANGDIVRYKSAKKLYLVSIEKVAGQPDKKFLISKSQSYAISDTFAKSQKVMRIMTFHTRDSYAKLVKQFYVNENNFNAFTELQAHATKFIKEAAAKAVKPATKKETTAVASVTKPVVTETPAAKVTPVIPTKDQTLSEKKAVIAAHKKSAEGKKPVTIAKQS